MKFEIVYKNGVVDTIEASYLKIGTDGRLIGFHDDNVGGVIAVVPAIDFLHVRPAKNQK